MTHPGALMTHPGAFEAHTEAVEAFLRTIEPLRLALELLIYHSVPTDSHHGAIKTLQAAISAEVGLEGSPWSHGDSP
jgi:hypothetical protein